MNAGTRPRVVIVGGGFGGLWAARALRRAPVQVTLIDRQNHHLFQPLLYQVATAALNPSDIAQPIRRVLRRQANAQVLLGEVASVDLEGRRVRLRDGASVPYDRLILATGATHSYFGHPEWEAQAPALKTLDDALEIRRRVLVAFEAAEREQDPALRAALLTFVVIGAGPTGVEMAGALAEISRQILRRDFRHIAPAAARVLLIEAGPRVLPAYSPASSASAQRQLERLGCEVRLGRPVTAVGRDGISLGGETIVARTVIWAAGVQASPLARSLDVPLDRAGRVRVQPDLTLPGHPEVQVIGDLAALEQDGKPIPGLAPAAMQMGRHAARNVQLAIAGRPLRPFRYLDKGTLATIGRARAVAERGKIRMGGFLAWVMWLAVHIFFLIGFRNRFLVLLEWAWVYLRNERGARLITGDVETLLARAGEGRAHSDSSAR
jgi:NADH dehydrogenase